MSTTEATLRSQLEGELFEPGEAGFEDTCTLFNASIERTPRMVIRCRSIADVVRGIRHARENGIPVSARSGGHSAAGWSICEGGVVLDMRDLHAITVDPIRRTVTAGGGCLTGAVDRALGEHGLATVTGRVSTTGIAGFTLGGGSGTLERRFGFAVDNLLGVEIVTADGAVIRADEQSHSDLFWALRGGGSNFGVVTELTFRAYPVGPTVTGGILVYPAAQGPAVLRNLRDVMESAPEHVGGYFAYLYGPDDEAIPAELHDEPIALVYLAHSGPLEDAERDLAPIRAYGQPAADFVEQTAWAELNASMDDAPGYRNYMTSENLSQLSDEVIEIVTRHAANLPAGPGWLAVMPWGGAVTRPNHDTPLTGRDTKWVVHPGAFWSDPSQDDAVRAWIQGLRADLRPHTSTGVWLNWIGDEGDARVRSAFRDAAYLRLQAVKAAYDPENVFRSNHNIAPSA